MAKEKAAGEPKFEKDLEKLEKIVEALEEGGLPLEVSIKKFEEGIQLAQRCEKALSAAEKRIELLTRNVDGSLQTRPLDRGEEADAGEESGEAEESDDDDDDDDESNEGEKDADDEEELLF